ncbi:anti-sigma 24 factor [Psychromonas sp. psych-6C06]|uniref:sigma-E factor negative regulatory protein n=1 Tax=Psychromonas sp. psych-6C06 TaxID=2058089 RepID=UPI000C32AE52|nr:RseA family anti-sigma factor [Psychromonas sp. psych-6C06]PKF60521.1 anti-sigma 24 factor [Psychromonas sp. psych-6C06]
MKQFNEQLSSLIDDENVESNSLDALINDKKQQAVFSRYQLIGDVIRNERAIDIDIAEQVMESIADQPVLATVTPITAKVELIQKPENNVISFVKRFGQYAIAASVAGVVVMTSFITSQPSVENNGIEVLNTVPFGGGVSPVSLQASQQQSKQALKDRHERLEALLKDHQLQLQVQQ